MKHIKKNLKALVWGERNNNKKKKLDCGKIKPLIFITSTIEVLNIMGESIYDIHIKTSNCVKSNLYLSFSAEFFFHFCEYFLDDSLFFDGVFFFLLRSHKLQLYKWRQKFMNFEKKD